MKNLILTIAIFLSGSSAFSQMTIAAARAAGVGQTVTVKGIATNGQELGNIRYLQDATGAIAAFHASVSSVNRYDSITVTGQITEFSGLLEIAPVSNVVYHGAAVNIPSALQIPLTSANELLESQYVRIDNVTFVQSGNFSNNLNSTVQVTDGTNVLDIRINASTNIDGTAIPTGPVSIYGLVGQFNANYQIVPRDLNDIIPYVAPSHEINVLINGSTYLTGSNYFHGTTTTIPVEVSNLGVNDLTLNSAIFSGPNSAAYSITIPAGTGTARSVRDTKRKSGSRSANRIYSRAVIIIWFLRFLKN